MTTDRRRFLMLSATAASGVAGCTRLPTGGDDDGSGSEDDSDENEVIVITEDDVTDLDVREEFTGYRWDEMPDREPEPTDSITIPSNYGFDPRIAGVELGTPLTVENTNEITHRIRIPRVGVDQELNATESFTVRFDVTGTFDFICTNHRPTHMGSIVVQEI